MPLTKGDGDLLFDMSDGCFLTVRRSVCGGLNKFRQTKKTSKEAGGVLLGRILERTGNYIVDEITTPKRTDRRSRYSFYRSKAHHDIALKRWKASGGECLYIGLWHSHPESSPTPSGVDFNDWKKALKNGRYEGDSLFFLIVGTVEIGCWRGVYLGRGVPEFYPLKRIDI